MGNKIAGIDTKAGRGQQGERIAVTETVVGSVIEKEKDLAHAMIEEGGLDRRNAYLDIERGLSLRKFGGTTRHQCLQICLQYGQNYPSLRKLKCL